jgi:curved DNA-binding protein CbpA
MADPAATDYYEVLNVSPRAHPLVIAKAYRLLAALYHPDNRDTGDESAFRQVVEAARILSDPASRATYDRQVFGANGQNGSNGHSGTNANGSGHASGTAGDLDSPAAGRVEDQREQRRVILQALYDMRRRRPDRPSVPLMVVPEIIGGSMDEAQFALWYLRGKKLIEPTDDGFCITVTGVDFVEGHPAEPGSEPNEILRLAPPRNELDSL